MNKKLLLLGCILGLTMVLSSCGKKGASNTGSESSENGQGMNSDSMAAVKNNAINNSSTVKIGNQEWMKENLNVSSFRNGDLIPEAQTEEEWAQASREDKPAWCNYNNSPDIGRMYGKLYNWYAVTDPRGLAPEGWHVPSAEEWDQMVDVFGSGAGTKLRSTAGWDEDKNGTNESGFNGLPGGFRYADGNAFLLFYVYGVWWTTTASEEADDQAEARHLAIYNPEMLWRFDSPDEVGRFYTEKGYGFSVRCIAGSGVSGTPNRTDNSDQTDIAAEASSTLKKLQGKWQHKEDTSNYIVFKDSYKKEIAGGSTQWDVEEFVISDKCMNELDKDRFPGGDGNLYISSVKNNMCWGIVELNETDLSLIFIGGPGRINSFRKIE